MMMRFICTLLLVAGLLSCRSTRKIQTAITKKDTVATAVISNTPKNDTANLIKQTVAVINANKIVYQTFTAKVNIDYKGGDGKSYNVNATMRMYKDSAIWISANALLGIEAMRVLITRDSVKLLNKLDKVYTARSVSYLKEVTQLPLDLHILQDLLIGNPVFLDSNIVSYSVTNGQISMLSIGEFFKNLITLNGDDKLVNHSKLDDKDFTRSRTADLTYNDYENKKGFSFSTKRRVVVTEKNRLDIKMDFKQYDFNGEVSFPFSVPKNYDRN